MYTEAIVFTKSAVPKWVVTLKVMFLILGSGGKSKVTSGSPTARKHSTIYIFIYWSVYLYIYVSIYLSKWLVASPLLGNTQLSIYLYSIYLSIYLCLIELIPSAPAKISTFTAYLSIYPSIYILSIYPSIYILYIYPSNYI